MSTGWQVDFNAIFGGIGGLLGWWSIGSLQAGSCNIWLASVVIDAGIHCLAYLRHPGATPRGRSFDYPFYQQGWMSAGVTTGATQHLRCFDGYTAVTRR